jgi:arabinogalactan endo-1,4-beta-galactosidase
MRINSPYRLIAIVALVSGVLLAAAPTATAAESPRAFPEVRSNLATKAWVTATATSASEDARLAIDGDDATAWLARGRNGRSLTVDLGGAYDNIRKIDVRFPDPDGGYSYAIDASRDGKRWSTVESVSGELAAGRVHLITHPGIAFLRLRITDVAPGTRVGVSEIAVWNYLRDDLILGADLSYADQDNQQGLTYYVDDPRDAAPLLDTASQSGMEYVRLRVFNDPRDERTGEDLTPAFQGPERTLGIAQQVKAQGMGLAVDLHYSDSWADPSKQAKPTAWRELPFDSLVDAVHDYTYETVAALIEQGTTPDKVAVGNEILNGFMWGSERPQPWFDESAWCGSCFFNHDPSFVSQPGGAILWQYWKSDDPAEKSAYAASWNRFTTLQAAGIRAVRQASEAYGKDIKVETHAIIDNGQLPKTLEFWNQFLTRLHTKGQDIDVIAHSYYPDWHGSPDQFEANLHAVAAAHPGYKLEIAETSHQSNDWDGVPVPNSPYPKTPEGAAAFYQRVFQMVNDLPDNRGIGALLWEPANWQEMIDWNSSAWPKLKFHKTIKVYSDSDADHVLEDAVWRTVRVRDNVVLPATVALLDTGSGVVTQVPVTWQPVPADATGHPGTVQVVGASQYGRVTATVDVVRRHLT